MTPVACPDSAAAAADSVASVADSAAGPAVVDFAADSAATSAAGAAADPPAEKDPLYRQIDSSPWSWIRPSDWKQPSRIP